MGLDPRIAPRPARSHGSPPSPRSGSTAIPSSPRSGFWPRTDTIRLSLNSSRQKTKNIVRHPACTLFILDLANTARYLELRADALVEPDDDYRFADRVGAKYGSDLRAHDQPGESRLVVTLHPHKVNAVNMGG